MCEFVENVRGVVDPSFGIIVSKGNDIVSHHHHLFNCSWVDDIIPQSVQKVQPPHAEHVVREDEVFHKEVYDT